jgi:hypothetical protein
MKASTLAARLFENPRARKRLNEPHLTVHLPLAYPVNNLSLIPFFSRSSPSLAASFADGAGSQMGLRLPSIHVLSPIPRPRPQSVPLGLRSVSSRLHERNRKYVSVHLPSLFWP